MNKTIEQYIKNLDDERLYALFEKVVNEMNRRKAAEVKAQGVSIENI